MRPNMDRARLSRGFMGSLQVVMEEGAVVTSLAAYPEGCSP
jgi:hypothetical protein